MPHTRVYLSDTVPDGVNDTFKLSELEHRQSLQLSQSVSELKLVQPQL